MLRVAVLLVLACTEPRSAPPPGPAALDASVVDSSIVAEVADVAEIAPPLEPTEIVAEKIFSGPSRVKTPPVWNAHLPKLAGDEKFLYAVHTHFTEATADRFAAIMRRPRAGGAWVEAARVLYPHQPPGIVIDRTGKLHMVFDCLRPAMADVTCFPGGAGTSGVESRFYHLIFSARDATGALRFDTYENHNEYTGHSNGYHGLQASNLVTVWSLANTTWGRVVQWRREDGATGTMTLSRPDTYLLYPIHAQDFLYAGEFDPKGGTNAGYPASIVYDTVVETGFSRELLRLTPSTPVPPGAVGSFPSDVLMGDVPYVLSYRVDGPNCTELRRFDEGISNPPRVFRVGCIDNYAKLQQASDNTLYILASSSSTKMRLGISRNRGETFTWKDLPVTGVTTGDTSLFGATPIKPYTSPLVFDPDRLVFLFSGTDATNTAQHSYLGTIALR